ncbi:MAG TPA: glycine--tRNA ligase subunit beta [Terriglobales bacterium]|nr:glycine--tRNA ligase subunit beta [Terriglobales bacterium]
MPKALLVELGTEEMPARVVEGLARQFAQSLNQRLNTAQLLTAEAGTPTVHFTPRRLLCLQAGVLEVQPTSEEQVLGPPRRVAFGADGKPSPQGKGFAAKNNVAAEDLFTVTTPKGEYVALRRKVGGGKAEALLAAIIPEAFGDLELPRSMRWEGELRFIRPLRWLVGLWGETCIGFRLGELEAGTTSWGHRSLGAGSFAVKAAEEFPARWRENFVITDPAERRAAIATAASKLLPAGLRLRVDAGLEDTLVNLTEYPDAILGSYSPAYLDSLPPEVLVTVMRDHQKYFAVEDERGRLAPHFVAVINQQGDPKGYIRHGNERVLRARFSDAQFFFDADRRSSLGERLPMLEQVTFQAKLGSYRDKSRRMRALATWLAELWKQAGLEADVATAANAAEMAKCDLTTDMVKEFPELQGIMGGHYALASGQTAAVAEAIADQYAWEAPPRSLEGAAVSLADKLDTIAGMFAIGEAPTGSADPFGLRRQANGVVRTLIERELPLSLAAACEQALQGYHRELPATTRAELAGFLRERLSFYLREVAGFAYDVVAAVLAVDADQPLEGLRRCAALASAPETAAVAAVIKRAGNIVRKEGWTAARVDEALLAAPAEQALHQAVAALPSDAPYADELAAISQLAAPLQRFFNEVRVNDENADIRANRLSLLAWTVARLSRLADFGELAGGAPGRG